MLISLPSLNFNFSYAQNYLSKLSARDLKIIAVATIIITFLGQLALWLWWSREASPAPSTPLEPSVVKESPPPAVVTVTKLILKESSPESVRSPETLLTKESDSIPLAEIPPFPSIDVKEHFLKIESNTKAVPMMPYTRACCRFNDIFCPQETIVKKPEKLDEPYLHANFVTLEGLRFIATQYPLTSQLTLFWNMCRNTSLIVDLTNQNDLRKGLTPYYPTPSKSVVESADLKVTYGEKLSIKEMTLPLHTYLVSLADQPPYVNYRLAYGGWNDQQGASEEDIDQMIEVVMSFKKSPSPVIVHCRAGVGRTGTIIVACALQEAINQGKVTEDNFFDFVRHLILQGREQRGPVFLQTEMQLLSLYKWGWKALHRGPRLFKLLECIQDSKMRE